MGGLQRHRLTALSDVADVLARCGPMDDLSALPGEADVLARWGPLDDLLALSDDSLACLQDVDGQLDSQTGVWTSDPRWSWSFDLRAQATDRCTGVVGVVPQEWHNREGRHAFGRGPHFDEWITEGGHACRWRPIA